MATSSTRGKMLRDQLDARLRAVRRGRLCGHPTRVIIWGVTPKGTFTDGLTLDAFVERGTEALVNSGKVYRFANTTVFETGEAEDSALITLSVQFRAEAGAAAVLTNVIGVGTRSDEGESQAIMSQNLIAALLAYQNIPYRLPSILYYTRRPTFDSQFRLCRPGWNPESGVLAHSPSIEPELEWNAVQTGSVADRLPPHLKELLREFCWASEADLVNAVGVLLTGLLVNHFIDYPHPLVVVDGNQRGVGKTLFVQMVGRVLDGAEPPRTLLVRDEELEKKAGAQLRDGRSSLFFYDNVRAKIDSPFIEQNALSPVIQIRILGQSANVSRPNTYLWVVTANQTAATEDFVSRAVVVRLRHEGDPKTRAFAHKPVEYVTRHRLEILGELAGMVLRWVGQGKPLGAHRHRCDHWAAIVGGILDVAGLGGHFLANADEAEAELNEGLQALASLAEAVVQQKKVEFYAEGEDVTRAGRSAAEWVKLFTATDVLKDQLVNKTPRGQAVCVANFLAARLGRSVPVQVGDFCGTATLADRRVRANTRLFFFRLQTGSAEVGGEGEPPAPPPAVSVPPPPPADDLDWLGGETVNPG